MIRRRSPSEEEQRLSQEVFSRAEKAAQAGSVIEEMKRAYSADIDNREKQYKLAAEREAKHFMILARVLCIPVALVACGYFLILGMGLYFGEITDISKYSDQVVSLQNEPIYFWFTFVFHAAMGAVFSWGAYKLALLAKGPKESNKRPPDTTPDTDPPIRSF